MIDSDAAPQPAAAEQTTQDFTPSPEPQHALVAALERVRALNTALIESAGSLVMVVDHLGRIVRFNQSCEYATGYRADEVTGRPFWDLFLAPERAAQVGGAFVADGDQPPVHTFDNYWLAHDGTRRLIAWSISVLRDETGAPDYVIGVGHDLTSRKEAEEAFAHLSHRTDLMLQAVGDGILGLDRGGRITVVNPAAAHMLGYNAEELLGRPAPKVLHPAMADLAPDGPADSASDDRAGAGHPINATLASGAVRRADDTEFRRKDGATFPVDYVSTPLYETGDLVGAVVVFRDITDRKRAQDALEHMALHDALTALPNRVLLHDRLTQALHGAARNGHSVALLLLDLDRFKEINDTLGHHHGDLLLRQVAARLRGAVRAMDTVARLGGDEFAVLLPQSDRAGAEASARKLIAALEASFVVEGQHLAVGVSIGIALNADHGADGMLLLRQADVAMYVAKRGRHGYDVYSPDLDEHSPQRLALMASLRTAIAQEQLVLYYQPKIDVATGELRGVEALLRWRHPDFGIIPPDEFVPMAEHTGLIGPLTLCVLEAAIRQCRLWQQAGLEMSVAVNLSSWNLHDPDLPETIAHLLQQYGLPSRLLRVEMTESTVMADTTRTLGVLRRLHEMGLSISVDDFGTGYSSLAYLKRLPIDEIKIDKGFVLHMDEDDADACIVSATIGLGRSLGVQVVAEGVETARIWGLLAALGCDLAQGYHFSRPLPAADLEPWIQQRAPAAP